MEILTQIENLGINKKALEKKAPQTAKKIQYVKEYVLRWLKVNAARGNIKNINFIDCMCNAGVYLDGDLTTAAEVLKLFISEAVRNPDKQYNLFVNDIDKTKLEACKKVFSALLEKRNPENVHIISSDEDVNKYLSNLAFFNKLLSKDAATILFVDPYDFGTVKLNILADFARRFYCEIIYNVFTSDFVRNGIDDRIRECIGDADIQNKDELIEYITQKLIVGKMEFSFSYTFCNMNKAEIYQIIFVTPHNKGLEKLKEALWVVFGGSEFYINPRNPVQGTLFDDTEGIKESALSYYSIKARDMLVEKFGGQTVTFPQLSNFVIERTMMRKTDCIRHVVIPLISEGRVIKRGKVKNKNNYNDDSYLILRLDKR